MLFAQGRIFRWIGALTIICDSAGGEDVFKGWGGGAAAATARTLMNVCCSFSLGTLRLMLSAGQIFAA